MFQELKSLLARRSLTITVAMLENELIRLNVVPHPRSEDSRANDQIKYSHKDEVAAVPEQAIRALTTPLSITGTAEEIDSQLPAALSQYADSHAAIQAAFNRASSEITEAVKAIEERNKAKARDKSPKKDDKTKTEEQKAKADDTLPLWWTDKSVAPPGAAQPALLTQSVEEVEQP